MIIKLFESSFSFDADDFDDVEEETIPHDDVIELGGYKWTKVGKIDGHDLYLCNAVVRLMAFSESGSNDWNRSKIRRWLNREFYNNLSDIKKDNIVKHPETNDNVFLLSVKEAEKVDKNIREVGRSWWLRSPGYKTDRAAYVYHDGGVYDYGFGVNLINLGVRHALLLK